MPTGDAITGALVYVYVGSTTVLATLYSDNGVTLAPNPLTTNTDGEYAFYAANGTYTVQITATSYFAEIKPGVVLFDPSDQAAATPLFGTGLNSNEAGFRIVPQNLQSTNYTTVASDSGKHVFTATGTITLTIASNASVPYPIGTAITFINTNASSVTIAINSDTLTLAGSTTTGSRTLAQNGLATALKVAATSWLISGVGLT